MRKLLNKIKGTKYFEEKVRFFLFVFLIFFVSVFSVNLLKVAYGRYETRTKIMASIDKALFIFDTDVVSFNIQPSGIIPRDNPYIYTFSVSNFNTEHDSDVDYEYSVHIRTTTNLPLNYHLYRNELYSDDDATDLLGSAQAEQDEDGAWYRVYDASLSFEMLYEDQTTDVFTLVIEFPSQYSSYSVYADYIENIEITVDAQQIV